MSSRAEIIDVNYHRSSLVIDPSSCNKSMPRYHHRKSSNRNVKDNNKRSLDDGAPKLNWLFLAQRLKNKAPLAVRMPEAESTSAAPHTLSAPDLSSSLYPCSWRSAEHASRQLLTRRRTGRRCLGASWGTGGREKGLPGWPPAENSKFFSELWRK